MERNASFTPETVQAIQVETIWGKIHMHSAPVDTVSVSAAGDEEALSELQLELENGLLRLQQPKFKFRLFSLPKSLEITLTVPETWVGGIDLSTVSAPISARQLRAAPSLALGTVSGSISAFDLQAGQIRIHTVSGGMDCSSLTGHSLELHSVSGRVTATELHAQRIDGNTVSGPVNLTFAEDFSEMVYSTVTGGVTLGLPAARVHVDFSAVTARLSYDGGQAPPDAPRISVSSVSGGLKIYQTTNASQ